MSTFVSTEKWQSVAVRTVERIAEVGWFDDIIGGDTEFLGVLDGRRRSSYEHCRNIALQADALGFDNMLLPTAYTVGQEALTFTASIAPFVRRIQLLTAIRTGEIHPPSLARSLANIDHILKGRFAINIINSDQPGLREDPAIRYQRCHEIIEILKQGWTRDRIQYEGSLYRFNLPADPVKPYQQNGGPLLYFGGTSEGSREVCARHCDVFLTWPDREEALYATILDMTRRAAAHNRKIDFGLRIHVVVRETEKEAREYAKRLVSRLDEQKAREIRSRGEDSRSLGVVRQDELRKQADNGGYIEHLLWTDIGKVFSGCGGGLVGSPEQIIEKLNRYMDMGFRAFIFSGFPLQQEAEHFSKLVLPHLPQASLAVVQNRVPGATPVTPYTTAVLQ
jgi:alkanesulfonate monooxygenase